MVKLIAVVGNTGVGKTTFVQRFCEHTGFPSGLEGHEERPFQELFTLDRQKYGFPNQIDFMVLRAEQEIEIRNSDIIGVQDGGLDEDFFLFTRLFYQKGYLTGREFALCERTYHLLREVLPPPDLFVWLRAPIEVIAERYEKRDRRLGIAKIEDLAAMEILLEEWLGVIPSTSLITIDTESEDRRFSNSIQMVLDRIHS